MRFKFGLFSSRVSRFQKCKELLEKSSLFDAKWYLSQYPDAMRYRKPPLDHYLKVGWKMRYWPNPLFDPAWYENNYPEASASGEIPIIHYICKGVARGDQPNIMFDASWYAEQYAHTHHNDLSPLIDYFRNGVQECRNPSQKFDTKWYLDTNPDVANSGMHPLAHYLHHGKAEGRLPKPQESISSARCAADFFSINKQALNYDLAVPPELRIAIDRLVSIDPKAEFTDATFPSHMLTYLLPDVCVSFLEPKVPRSMLTAQELQRRNFYSLFRQKGGKHTVQQITAKSNKANEMWLYVGDCSALPNNLLDDLETYSFLVHDTASKFSDATKSLNGRDVTVIVFSRSEAVAGVEQYCTSTLDLSQDDGSRTLLNTGEASRSGGYQLQNERRSTFAITRNRSYKQAFDSDQEVLPVATLDTARPVVFNADQLVCMNGHVETAGTFSWIWFGPERRIYIALGRLIAENMLLEIDFTAFDQEIADQCMSIFAFEVNGKPAESSTTFSGLNGTSKVLVPPNLTQDSIILALACRNGKKPDGDHRTLTAYITSIRIFLAASI